MIWVDAVLKRQEAAVGPTIFLGSDTDGVQQTAVLLNAMLCRGRFCAAQRLPPECTARPYDGHVWLSMATVGRSTFNNDPTALIQRIRQTSGVCFLSAVSVSILNLMIFSSLFLSFVPLPITLMASAGTEYTVSSSSAPSHTGTRNLPHKETLWSTTSLWLGLKARPSVDMWTMCGRGHTNLSHCAHLRVHSFHEHLAIKHF